MARRHRSIPLAIVLGSLAVGVTITLLVAWILVILKNQELSQQVADTIGILVLGIVSFAFIIVILILFVAVLVREILVVRRQDTFIDSVTHELKSPLASMKLAAETLGRTGLDESRREQLRTIMLADMERLSGFINAVLEAARDDEVQSQAPEDVRLAELIEQSIRHVEARHRLAKGSIERFVPDDLVICTVPSTFQTVVTNLVDNAVKYSVDSPRVEVRATCEPDATLVIEVTDRGIGFLSAQGPRLFERFFRVDTEEVRRRSGTGLGLFVVGRLIRRLGGRATIRSDGPGKGATATIRLPEVIRQ